MRITIVISIVLLFLLTACNYSTENGKIEDTVSSFGLSIGHSIDEYSVTMSSVPGFPLEIVCTGASKSNLSLVADCEDGSFLIWNKDGTIETIGKSYKGEFKKITLYWSPMNDLEQIVADNTNFSVGIFNQDTEKISNKVEGEFVITENKNYTIRYK